ncbi:MAG: Fe-S cluster assembly protein SufD [Planctomycetes bacterium]|nr:Fe-S cluster assembly protein SufD [Planctomycetota bacterium]
MSVAVETKDTRELFISEHARVEDSLAGSRLGWLLRLRKAAIRSFAERGYPTLDEEDWRQTSVAPIARTAFRAAEATKFHGRAGEELEREAAGGLAACRLVFVNGFYAPELSSVPRLPEGGLRVGSLAALLRAGGEVLEPHLAQLADDGRNPFVALNTAFFADGPYVHVPARTALDFPVHLLYVATESAEPAAAFPRALLVTERETKATFIETFVGPPSASYFTNAVSELLVGENAHIEHVKLQREGDAAFHVATLQARQARNSNFVSHSFSLGGLLVRNDLNVVLDGEGIETTLNGLFRCTGRQHIDNHTLLDHAKPHGSSRELYKGILDGASKGVFNGKIIVRKDAQLTDAQQTNMNLLLSDEAYIDTKPQLEIFADDVKCKHGATIGAIDSDALFYLRSRGIPSDTARRMLITAFANEMIGRVPVEPVRERLLELIPQQLLQGR